MAAVPRFDSYAFGPFVLETGNSLLHAGRPVRLAPKEFAVLHVLVAAAGAVVSRDELATGGWGRWDVSDESISRCIYSLRTTLARHGGREFIETVYGRGYRLDAEVHFVRAGSSSVAPEPLPRLAVLPFETERADPKLDWAAAALAEELIGFLGRRHANSFAVIARTSVARYAGVPLDVRTIARDLQLDYVVTGRVDGQGLRITLVRCADDVAVWSDRTALEPAGSEGISPEAVRLLARRIPVPTPASAAAVAPADTGSSAAYSEYLQARYLLSQRGGANLMSAVEHYRRALALDPRYARAHVGIANCFLFGGLWAALSPAQVVPLATVELDAALAIDPDLPGALAARGMLLSAYLFRPDEAAPLFERALAALPNDSEVHLMYGRHLLEVGRPRDAVLTFRGALEFDPQNPNHQMYLAKALHFAREHAAAVEQARRAAEIVPSYAIPHAFVAAVATGAGPAYREEALVAARRAAALDASTPAVQWTLMLALALNGATAEARRLFTGEQERWEQTFRMPALAVLVAGALGDVELAVRALQLANSQGDPWLPLLLRDPRLDALYDDDRFVAAVGEIRIDRPA